MTQIQDIKSKLWEMANKLRGTMDASEYKNYILPFMFYRYLSKHQDEYLTANGLEGFYTETDTNTIDEYLHEITNGIGYAINPEFTWTAIIDKIDKNQIVASDFQDMLASFKTNAKRNASSDLDFENVFSDVNLGDSRLGGSTNERAKALIDVIDMIDTFEYKDENGKDLLGDVYEYLIGQFAATAGKKGGEFYTPHEVSQVLAKIVTNNVDTKGNQFRVYDPTMGSGSLLLTVQKELPNGSTDGSVDFYGQELNTTTYNLARMNMMMHGVQYRNMHLRRGDTLDLDWPFIEKNGVQTPRKFDAVVANPPYSQKWDTKDVEREKDVRFKSYAIAPASKADYAFILHSLYHLEANGTMAVVLPHGVLFRGASEGKIRQRLIEENLLDTVIGLPANLFYGASIPTCVLVFKGREARNNTDILFIDASNEFEKVKTQNKLTEEHINKIIDTYSNRTSIEKYSHVATLDEIKSNDYNLNIPRYVDTFEEEEVKSLSEISSDLTRIQNDINTTSATLCEMLNELVGSNEEEQNELEYLKKILFNN